MEKLSPLLVISRVSCQKALSAMRKREKPTVESVHKGQDLLFCLSGKIVGQIVDFLVDLERLEARATSL